MFVPLRRLALLFAVLAFLPPAPAQAAAPELPDQIAAAWRKDPLYVDPAMRPGFPRSELDRIRAAARAAGFTVYVALVPNTPYTRQEQVDLPTLLQARVGQPGLYVIWRVSDEYWYGRAELFRPAGLKGRDLTRVQLDDKLDNKITNERPAPKIVRTIQQAGTAYDGRPLPEIPASDLEKESVRSGRSTTDKEDLSAYIGMGVGGVIGFLLTLILVLRHRRRPSLASGRSGRGKSGRGKSGRSKSGRGRSSKAAAAELEPATQVHLSTVRSQADRWIPKAGRALRTLEKRREQTTDLLDRRDDARARLDAAKTLRNTDPEDLLTLTGAFVLARQAFQLASGNDLVPPCFFDPTHPSGTFHAAWSDDTEVPACKTCAETVERGRTPRGLLVPMKGLLGIDRAPEPYWTLDPEDSPMVATGFGALSDDLAERVERVYGGVR
ncbi:hypothetical protein GCM10009789_20120 [Kribbella sancticallisti]|uniref:TPM domain-containing protein n=1 Tax=Kribbella sancticallisti TaxID=460087 RepID=A0ABN2CYZ8_9ACTN